MEITFQFITWFLSIAYLILIISTIIIVLTENADSSKTLIWLILLMFLPAIGLLFYYIFGYNPRRRGKSQESFAKFKSELLSRLPEEAVQYINSFNYRNKVLPRYKTLVRLLEKSNESQVFYGSNVEIITFGRKKFDLLINDLENAKHHIHFEYFYFRKGKTGRLIREILMRKAAEGVEVRFIYENIANIDINPRYYYKMRKSGVKVLPFTKISLPWIRRSLNYRDHRKIVVIDGEIGYTGGMNITDNSMKWRDTHLRITGQGVYGLQMNFMHAWYDSKGDFLEDLSLYFPKLDMYSQNLMQVVPEAPDSRFPYLKLAVVNAVVNAEEYIYIQTPYYMPSDSVLQALKSAALSGVDVRVMVSRKSDIFFMDWTNHSYYEESLQAGIRIYEIKNFFSHTKSMVIDDYVSIIGSANMDTRSLELSFEINTFMYDVEVARDSYEIFFEDMQNCTEMRLEDWLKRPWWKKLGQSVMRLLSPLF